MKIFAFILIILFNIYLFLDLETYYIYYPKYENNNGYRITAILRSFGYSYCNGIDEISKLNSLGGYRYKKEQDEILLDLLKEGKLIKEKITIPNITYLTKLFKRTPFLFDNAYEFAILVHYLFKKDIFPQLYKYGIIGIIISNSEFVGKLYQEEKYLDDIYDFSNKYEGKTISEFSLSEIKSMIEDLNKKGMLKYFKLGLKHWTEYNDLLSLFEYYKEASEGKDNIELHQIYIAESLKLIDDINEKYKKELDEFDRYYYCSYSLSENSQINNLQRIILQKFEYKPKYNIKYGMLIYELLNLKIHENKKINIEEKITSLTKGLFDQDIKYEKGKLYSFEKSYFNIKIKEIFDRYEKKYSSDRTYIIYERNLFSYPKRFDEEINNILFYIIGDDKFEEKLKNILNGIIYINYNPKSEILEIITNPMSGDYSSSGSEYDEGFIYEISPKKLANEEIEKYQNLIELRLSSINFKLEDNENSIKLKMKAPFEDCYEFSDSNDLEIYIYSSIGNILYPKKKDFCFQIQKDEILYINIISRFIKDIHLSVKFKNYKNYLPYQPVDSDIIYDKSNTEEDPLQPFEITYKKRKGNALYIYSNNPERLTVDNFDKAIIRNIITDKEVFFTMEHNCDFKDAYMGYRLKNIGDNYLYVTVRNAGYYISNLNENDWTSHKEWIDFYNINFRLRNKEKLSNEELAILQKKVSGEFDAKPKNPITYRIPPGKYFYVLGGTLEDTYNNINVFGTISRRFSRAMVNGAVLFEVKGTAEAALFCYKYSRYIKDNDNSGESLINGLYDNGDLIGAQYKGYDNYHGVVDGYAFWKFNDKTQPQFLPVKIVNYFRDGNNLENQVVYSEISDTIKHEHESNFWVTNSNPQKKDEFRESKIGSDLIEFHIHNSDNKDIIIDNYHYDGRGKIANTANWMTNYITSYYLVNLGSKEREVTITISCYGVVVGFVVDSNGNIISESEQYAIYDNESGKELFHNFIYTTKIDPKGEIKFFVEHTLLANGNGKVIHKAELK